VSQRLRPMEWTGNAIRIIDQTLLPGRLEYADLRTVDGLVDAIVRLAVRGAPALGAVGALGVALAMRQAETENWDESIFDAQVARIRDARPTAVNLAWAVDRVRPLVGQGIDAVLAAASEIFADDTRTNHAISRNGADWILAHVAHRPVRILTHCNTGMLATTEQGTALGIIREMHARGQLELVYADETRPLLQGSRLTAWELAMDGIPHVVQVDGAAASTILRGLVDVAIFGADRIAANGDTANKIGSLGVALACADAGIPLMVAAPESTVDPATPSGDAITIEMRPEFEVLEFAGTRVAPLASRGFNPAFDVTPGRLITAMVTERGVLEVSRGELPGGRAPVAR
jgi:methylthioribose-1-phosphate isomerase